MSWILKQCFEIWSSKRYKGFGATGIILDFSRDPNSLTQTSMLKMQTQTDLRIQTVAIRIFRHQTDAVGFSPASGKPAAKLLAVMTLWAADFSVEIMADLMDVDGGWWTLMDVDGCKWSILQIRSSKLTLHTVSRSFKYKCENIAVQNSHHAEHAWDVVKKPAVQKCCDSLWFPPLPSSRLVISILWTGAYLIPFLFCAGWVPIGGLDCRCCHTFNLLNVI